ncbi:MAG TPA: hypothetical protein VL325_08825, partial [Pyrinomonadaceae bacterium]|nr:hypothetical protein [Pyrinomonadaceae bacterium]
QTMMARKKPVMRQAELCVLASADHESVVLIKYENAPGLRPGDDVQCNAHQKEYKGIKVIAPTS